MRSMFRVTLGSVKIKTRRDLIRQWQISGYFRQMHAAVAIGSTTSKVVEMILDFGERPISQWHVLF